MRLTSWLLRIVALLSVAIILQERYDVGLFGIALMTIVAIVWAACAYLEREG